MHAADADADYNYDDDDELIRGIKIELIDVRFFFRIIMDLLIMIKIHKGQRSLRNVFNV